MSKKYYTLLKSDKEAELVDGINAFIEDGYEPLGGLVLRGEDFYQALYRPKATAKKTKETKAKS